MSIVSLEIFRNHLATYRFMNGHHIREVLSVQKSGLDPKNFNEVDSHRDCSMENIRNSVLRPVY